MKRGTRMILIVVGIVAAAAAFVLYLTQQSPRSEQATVTTVTPAPRVRVVAARIDIPAGTILTDTTTYLTFEEIPQSQYAAGAQTYYTRVDEIVGRVALRDIVAPALIRTTDLIEAGLSLQIPTAQAGASRPKAMPLQVNSLTGVADLIQPGDSVDLVASFDVPRTSIQPGITIDPTTGSIIRTYTTSELQTARSTKTLLQNIQVLKILKPQVTPEGTPTADGTGGNVAPPATGAGGEPVSATESATTTAIQPGAWLLILAVTDQQAEVVQYALEQSTRMSLVLRGRGDIEVERTTGATLDLLISQYGLPLPEPMPPAVGSPDLLTPLPVRTPVPIR